MMIPEFLYGTYPAVRARARKMARAVVTGAPIDAIEGTLIDSATRPGLLVVKGPSPLIVGEHFHCFSACREICEMGIIPTSPKWEDLFGQLVSRAWGIVSLLSPDGTWILVDGGQTRQRRFLESVVASWADLTDSARYSRGGSTGERFEKVATGILGVLTKFGVGPTPEEVGGYNTGWEDTIHDRILSALGKAADTHGVTMLDPGRRH